MAKPQKQQNKRPNQGINITNFFDSAVIEYVENPWPQGLSDGVWRINGMSVSAILFDIVLSPEAWILRKGGGVFKSYGVDHHFRRALKVEHLWCKDFILSALRGLVMYVSSAIHCETYRNTTGPEKIKFREADAASASFEKQFM